jgi:hypothetical protein
MPFNRLIGYLSERRPTRFSFEATGEERASNSSEAFVACPMAFIPVEPQIDWRMSIYRLAYEQAQAAVAARQEAREAAYPWN